MKNFDLFQFFVNFKTTALMAPCIHWLPAFIEEETEVKKKKKIIITDRVTFILIL